LRRVRFYRILTLFCLWAAGAALVLAAVAFVLAHGSEAAAALLCSAVFFVPGFLFLRYWRRLYARDLALAHAAKLADEAGITDGKRLGSQLHVPEGDAAKILATALREGHLQGEMDAKGQFVSATAPRCPSCGEAAPRAASRNTCPSCGRPMARGA
jgi:hypothetical protein